MLRVIANIVREQLPAKLRSEQGQGLAEYAMVLTFVALVAIGALTLLGSNVSSIISGLGKAL